MEYLQFLPLWYIYYAAGRRARMCWRNCGPWRPKQHSTSLHSDTLVSQQPNSKDVQHSNTLALQSQTVTSNLLLSDQSNTQNSSNAYNSHSFSTQLRNLHPDQSLYNSDSNNSHKSPTQPQHSNEHTHSLHSDSQPCDHADTLLSDSVHSTPLNSRWRLAALCALHSHVVAPALCVFVATAFQDSGVDHRIVKGMMLASAGGPCGWLSLALCSNNAERIQQVECIDCDINDKIRKTNVREHSCNFKKANINISDNDKRRSKDTYNIDKKLFENITKSIGKNNSQASSNKSKERFSPHDIEGTKVNSTKDEMRFNDNIRKYTNDHLCGVMTPLLLVANYVTAIVAVPALMIVICGRGAIPDLSGIVSDILNTFPPFILGVLLTSPKNCHCSEKSVTECKSHTALKHSYNGDDIGANSLRKYVGHYVTCKIMNGFREKNYVLLNTVKKYGYDVTAEDCGFQNEDDDRPICKDDEKKDKCEITNEYRNNKTNCDIDNSKILNIMDNNMSTTLNRVKNKTFLNSQAVKLSDESVSYNLNFDDNPNRDINASVTNLNGIIVSSNKCTANSTPDTAYSNRDANTSRGISNEVYSRAKPPLLTLPSAVCLRVCGLVLVYCECCARLREAEGALGVGDVMLTLGLALCWVFASACLCDVYRRVSRDADIILVCALPKCFHAGWLSSASCTPSGLSLLPAALLAPTQALTLAAFVTHRDHV